MRYPMMKKDTMMPSRYSSPTMFLLDAIAADNVPQGDGEKDYCDHDED